MPDTTAGRSAAIGRLGIGFLIVDDDMALALALGKALRRRGHRVITCASVEEALAAMETPDEIQLVVTDLDMPRASGLDLAQARRNERPRLPVVLMSGRLDPVRRAQADTLGVQAVLVKPFELDEFMLLIEQLCAWPRKPRES